MQLTEKNNTALIAILIPTFGRSSKIPSIIANIRSTCANIEECIRIYFILERSDIESTKIVSCNSSPLVKVIYNQMSPGYSGAINTGYHSTSEPFMFLSADDVELTDDCLKVALVCMQDTTIGVVGTNDLLGQWSDHSTNSLVRRSYIENSGGLHSQPNKVFADSYHTWVDWELNSCAKARGGYFFCQESQVKHHHPGWRNMGMICKSSPLYDAVYKKNYKRYLKDSLAFITRAQLWRKELKKRGELSLADKFILNLTSSKYRFLIKYILYCIIESSVYQKLSCIKFIKK